MFVLFIVLNGVDYLEDILAKFVDIGVRGATILDSQGMASAILESQNRGIPLFGLFESLLDDSRPYNKTIFTVLESEELVKKAVAAVYDVMKDVPQIGAGFMFSIPIDNIYKMGKTN